MSLLPWLAPTATSTIFLLSQVTGADPGQDVVRYRAGGGGGEGVRGGEGRGMTDVRGQEGRP